MLPDGREGFLYVDGGKMDRSMLRKLGTGWACAFPAESTTGLFSFYQEVAPSNSKEYQNDQVYVA